MEVSALSHPSSIPGLRGPSALLRLQSDERLITLTRRGQHAAFEVLCARYQTRLLSFCRHMLGSREDAEDVLQEVFAAAFNAVLADERDINVRPWLYRIARNRSLNHLRRASAIGVDSMDVHFADGGISTGDKVMRRESFRELIDDVHQLPETQRTALLLREIDALSYDQIALAMDTTVPSVKSLLVRARISLAEAAEARKLSCDDVRLELGGVAEGLAKLSTPARRHIRSCQRCSLFRKQLKDNNRALALIMPVGPLLLLKKLVLAKLGSTASAGGAHVAGGAGAAASATAGAGAAAGAGSGVAGSIVTAGAGALATKAVAGLAAAAIVTAGVAAAEHVAVHHHHHPSLSASTASAGAVASRYADEPVVVRQAPQPVTASVPAPRASLAATHSRHRTAVKKAKPATAAPPTPPVTPASATTLVAARTGATATPPAKPADPAPVTEVTTDTTELPASATTVPSTTPTPATTTSSSTPTATTPTATTPPTSTPSTPTSTAPSEIPPTTTPSTPPSTTDPNDETTTPDSTPNVAGDSDANTGGTAAPATEVSTPVAATARVRRLDAGATRRGLGRDRRLPLGG
jgi:RNA polymerase sigma factor (sigma-70 family)